LEALIISSARHSGNVLIVRKAASRAPVENKGTLKHSERTGLL